MNDMSIQYLYDDGKHKFLFLGWEEDEEEGAIQTNQYAIVSGNEAMLLDPGGVHVFPRVLANIAEVLDIDKITAIFYTHQDPDVSSGISLWLSSTDAKVYISELWVRFLPHFGIFDTTRVKGILDRGMTFKFSSGDTLEFVPTHFMHSVGNFTLYDPKAKIFFSGDIGAAVFPKGKRHVFVDDFDSHLKYIEGFHRRYMPSHEVCKKWVERVRRFDIDILAPQHGAIYRGEDVKKFLNWLAGIRCGMDNIQEIWGR